MLNLANRNYSRPVLCFHGRLAATMAGAGAAHDFCIAADQSARWFGLLLHRLKAQASQRSQQANESLTVMQSMTLNQSQIKSFAT
jgi:hypothetical protein